MLEWREAEALLIVKLDRLTRSVADLGSLVERYFAPGKAALRGRIHRRSGAVRAPCGRGRRQLGARSAGAAGAHHGAPVARTLERRGMRSRTGKGFAPVQVARMVG